VDALVAALDRCAEARGHALVVSNGEPRPVAELLAAICRAAGVRAPRHAVPATLARWAGAAVEAVWALRAAPGDPPMTRFLAEQLSTAHWFDQRRTTELLGWTPRVGIDAGLAALAAEV
jgi:nucleoside-diphosphate-sugar epimerase